MDASERKRERDRNREDRKGATSQLERAIDNVSTGVYHIRVSHSTVVGAYDAIEAFGSSTTGKGPASVLATVLTEAIATLRRDGHVPERTTAEVAERMAGVRGNLGMDVTLPSMTLRPTAETPPQDISQAIEEALAKVPQAPQQTTSSSLATAVSIDTQDIEASSDEEQILSRLDDPLVQEVIKLGTAEAKSALLNAYTQLRKEQWGTSVARALYEFNLSQ